MNNKQKTLNLVNVIVNDLITEFIDDNNKGPAFTWEKAPSLIARLTASNLCIYFPDMIYKSAEFDELKKLAYSEAMKLATSIIKDMKLDS